MADPITIIAGVSAGLSTIGGIASQFTGNRLKKLQEEVLQERLNIASEQRRRAQGVFTPAERRTIEAGNEPTLNTIAGNLAGRGLSEGGAGADILAEARQRPFLQAQQTAQLAQGAEFAAIAPSIDQQLAGSQAQTAQFFDDISTIVKGVALLKKFEGNTMSPNGGGDGIGGGDPVLKDLDELKEQLTNEMWRGSGFLPPDSSLGG